MPLDKNRIHVRFIVLLHLRTKWICDQVKAYMDGMIFRCCRGRLEACLVFVICEYPMGGGVVHDKSTF
jgi:hypothetical protein